MERKADKLIAQSRSYILRVINILLRSKENIGYYFVAALLGVGYWVVSYRTWPSEGILIKLLYRFTDPEYYPYIVNLSKFNFFEFVNFDLKDKWGILFPFAGVMPYSILVSFFGLFGFIISDIAVGLVRLYLYERLLVSLRVKNALPYAVILLLLTSDVVISNLSQFIGVQFSGLWTDRIPRDYVTSLFLISQILLIVYENLILRKKWGLIVFTLPLVLLLHSDVHTFLILLPIVMLRVLQFYRSTYTRYLHSIISGILFLLGSLIFFVLININISLDLKERWGQYSVTTNFLSFQTTEKTKLLISIGIFLFVWWTSHFVATGASKRILKLCRVCFYSICISFFASPLLSFFLNKNIQDYQFPIRTDSFITFHLLLSILFLVFMLKQKLANGRFCFFLKVPLLFAAMGLYSFYASARWEKQVNIETQPSVVTSWGMHESKNYRRDLNRLDEFLSKIDTKDKILLTFDHHISLYWLFQGNRFLYLGDPIWSNQDTEMLYRRFFAAAKLLKFDKSELRALLLTYYYQLRFITGGSLQGNRLHQKFPLDQYSKDNLVQILNSLDNWGLVIPEAYVDSILVKYANIETSQGNPDFIILNVSYPVVNRNSADFPFVISRKPFMCIAEMVRS